MKRAYIDDYYTRQPLFKRMRTLAEDDEAPTEFHAEEEEVEEDHEAEVRRLEAEEDYFQTPYNPLASFIFFNRAGHHFGALMDLLRTNEVVIRFDFEDEWVYCLAVVIPNYTRQYSGIGTASSSAWPPKGTTTYDFPDSFKLRLSGVGWTRSDADVELLKDEIVTCGNYAPHYNARKWPIVGHGEDHWLDWCETREWHASKAFPAALLDVFPRHIVDTVYGYAYKFA